MRAHGRLGGPGRPAPPLDSPEMRPLPGPAPLWMRVAMAWVLCPPGWTTPLQDLCVPTPGPEPKLECRPLKDRPGRRPSRVDSGASKEQRAPPRDPNSCARAPPSATGSSRPVAGPGTGGRGAGSSGAGARKAADWYSSSVLKVIRPRPEQLAHLRFIGCNRTSRGCTPRRRAHASTSARKSASGTVCSRGCHSRLPVYGIPEPTRAG
jgi:hypothetical protein